MTTFNIYASNNPINVDDLPVPIGSVTDIKNYTEENVDVDGYRYYRIGAVKSGMEKLSDELKIWCSSRDEHWDKVLCLLHFNGNATDQKGNTWTAVGATYEAGLFDQGARFDGSTLRYFQSPNNADFRLTTDTTIEFSIKLLSNPASNNYAGVVSQRYNYANQSFSLFINPNTSVLSGEFKMSNGGFLYLSHQLTLGLIERIAVELDVTNKKARIFSGGVLMQEVDMPYSLISVNYPIRVGTLDQATNNGRVNAIVEELRITKGVCRYIDNYTPSLTPFPNT